MDKFDVLFKRYSEWEDVKKMRLELQKIIPMLNSLECEIYPPVDKIFVALRKISKTKVVIIGQDPYHSPGQAMGLSFSVSYGVGIPPSLQNIYKELASDLPKTFIDPKVGNLLRWKKQGVCLLNASLTVEKGKPKSHSDVWLKKDRKRGEKSFSELLVKFLKDAFDPVFVLWGKDAQSIYLRSGCEIDFSVICSSHPSPMAVIHGDFFGSKPFSRVNRILQEKGKTPIDWSNVS